MTNAHGIAMFSRTSLEDRDGKQSSWAAVRRTYFDSKPQLHWEKINLPLQVSKGGLLGRDGEGGGPLRLPVRVVEVSVVVLQFVPVVPQRAVSPRPRVSEIVQDQPDNKW